MYACPTPARKPSHLTLTALDRDGLGPDAACGSITHGSADAGLRRIRSTATQSLAVGRGCFDAAVTLAATQTSALLNSLKPVDFNVAAAGWYAGHRLDTLRGRNTLPGEYLAQASRNTLKRRCIRFHERTRPTAGIAVCQGKVLGTQSCYVRGTCGRTDKLST
jgi:hypothetical protein